MVDIWSDRKRSEVSNSDRVDFCGIVTYDRLHRVQGQGGVGLYSERILSFFDNFNKILTCGDHRLIVVYTVSHLIKPTPESVPAFPYQGGRRKTLLLQIECRIVLTLSPIRSEGKRQGAEN
jgi:hypothetical protein